LLDNALSTAYMSIGLLSKDLEGESDELETKPFFRNLLVS
jgi:hypothetical protein